MDLPRAREGGLSAGFFAVFVRTPRASADAESVVAAGIGAGTVATIGAAADNAVAAGAAPGRVVATGAAPGNAVAAGAAPGRVVATGAAPGNVVAAGAGPGNAVAAGLAPGAATEVGAAGRSEIKQDLAPAPGSPQAASAREVSQPSCPALAEPLDPSYALQATMAMVAGLLRLEAVSAGQIKIVRTVDELDACLETGVLAAILHFEGAEAIDADLNSLEVFYRLGLRSLGIVWSRPNAFGHGVPFLRGHSPDIGPGLTDAGKALVRACNQLGIMIDVSHLNEKGFWDVARITEAPIVATHSCAYALCPVPRNLTDRQLDAIRESDGMVGVNFSVNFLCEDDDEDRDTLEPLIRHVDYLVDRLGIDRVGLGSDFDGTRIPAGIGDVTGLPGLIAALRERGYDEQSLMKLTNANWRRVLEHTWRADC
jgi:membrane dipeptidase